MPANSYIKLNDKLLRLGNLPAVVLAQLQAGIGGFKSVGPINLTPTQGEGSVLLGFRNSGLEYSLDGGTTWVPITSGGGGGGTEQDIETVTGSSLTAVPGKSYLVSSSTTGLTVNVNGTSGKAGDSWIQVQFGNTASITAGTGLTLVDDPYPGKTNLLHVVFWGTTARLYVQDAW